MDDSDPFFSTRAHAETADGLTGFTLNLGRTQATLALAWFMLISMWALALAVLGAAALQVRKRRVIAWPALGWMAATLFALAAFRNTAAGTPPFGCLLDYTAFLWAEGIVAACVVVVAASGIRHDLRTED